MAHDLDPAVERRARNAFLLALIGVGTAISIFTALVANGDRALTNRDLINHTVALIVAFGILVGATWRRLAVTAINRRIIGALALVFADELATRLIGLAMHIEPNAVLAIDMLSHAAIAAFAGVVSVRWTVRLFPPFAVGAILTALRPELASIAFSVADGCAIAALIVFWRKRL